MAEKTVEELQKELAAAKAATKAAQAETAALAAKAKGKVALPVKGSYTATWKTPDGKSQSKKVAFVDGHRFLFCGGKRMRTELFLKVANGKELSAEELAANQGMKGLDKEAAEKHLTHLAKIDYAYIK